MSSERPDRPRRPYAAPTVSPLSQPGVFVWQRSSRWMPILATTNSGKMLFVCLCCGRQSPFPDKVCPGSLKGRDGVSFTCAEWERMPRQVVGPVKADANDPSVLETMVDEMAGETQTMLSDTRAKLRQQEHDTDTAIKRLAEVASYFGELPSNAARNKALAYLAEAISLVAGTHHAELPLGGWKELLVEPKHKRTCNDDCDCDGETRGVCSGCLNCTCDEDNDEV